jgi:hypothetical protein
LFNVASKLKLPGGARHHNLSEATTEYLAFKLYGPEEIRNRPGGYSECIASLKKSGNDRGGKLGYVEDTRFVELIAEAMGLDSFSDAFFKGDERAITRFVEQAPAWQTERL